MVPERRAGFRTALAFLALTSGVSCAAPQNIEPEVKTPIQTAKDDFAVLKVIPILETRESIIDIGEVEIKLLEQMGRSYTSRLGSSNAVSDFCRGLPEFEVKGATGEFQWPTYGPIYSWFSPRHQGLDITPPYGTPVYAAEEGIVVGTFDLRYSYGEHILVYHSGGSMTLYAHLSAMFPKIGNRVRKQEQIGRVGMTGYATGPHLHFELLQGCRQVDPLDYLRR